MHPEILVKEQERPTELLAAAEIGLQARLLLGELSNPQVEITKKRFRSIKNAGATGINEQVSEKYQKASLTQRRRHQQETGLTLSQWRDGFDTYLKKVRQDTKHTERKEFLETIGITDVIDAKDFYAMYLRGESGIIKFVDTVETQATREQIQQHQDIIRQLGNAFGYECSTVISHLIHGVRNVKDDIDTFTRKANKKINDTDVLHHPLLSRIADDVGEERKMSPKKAVPAKKVVPAKTAPAMAVPLAKSTPVKRIDLDKESAHEPEAKPPKKKERPRKRTKEPVQVFPAPVRKERQEQEHHISDDQLSEALQLLLGYGNRSDQEQQVLVLRESERMNNYAKELHAMMEEYGRGFVLERAENAVQRLQAIIRTIGLKSDKLSKNEGWYLVGIAKARFLARNIDQEKRPTVEMYDPLLHYRIGRGSTASEGQKSYDAEEAIINDMLGWEVYRQRKKVLDILAHLDPLMPPRDKVKFQTLLAQAPKERSRTLSGSELREIGKLVRKYIPRR